MGLKAEVAFIFNNASIVFHRNAMKNMSKEVKNEMNDNFWFILIHNWY